MSFNPHGDADEPKKKRKNHREEVRAAILRAISGPEPVVAEIKEALPLAPETYSKDLSEVLAIINAIKAKYDDEEEAILLLL